MSLLLTGDTGRTRQLDLLRARADSAPDKPISALVAEVCSEIEAAAVDLQSTVTPRDGVVYDIRTRHWVQYDAQHCRTSSGIAGFTA